MAKDRKPDSNWGVPLCYVAAAVHGRSLKGIGRQRRGRAQRVLVTGLDSMSPCTVRERLTFSTQPRIVPSASRDGRCRVGAISDVSPPCPSRACLGGAGRDKPVRAARAIVTCVCVAAERALVCLQVGGCVALRAPDSPRQPPPPESNHQTKDDADRPTLYAL